MCPASTDKNENIIHKPFDIQVDLNKGLGEYIWEALNKYKNEIAQIDTLTGKKQTYGDFLNRSILLAKALRQKGVTPDDVVTYCCYNNMDYAITIIATLFIGAKLNPLDISASSMEILHCLNLSKPRIVFCDQEIEDLMESAKSELNLNYDIVVFDETGKNITFDEFLEKFKSNDEFKIDTSKNGKDTACISYTSGTSGLSKAAQLTHFALYYGGIAGNKAMFGSKILMIFTLPYWISNLALLIISTLNGLTRIIYKKFDRNDIFKIIQDYKVELIILTQSLMVELLNYPECCNYDTSLLKHALFGGSNIAVNQIIEIKKMLPHTKLINAFGMTEFGGIVFLPSYKDYNLTSMEKIRFPVGSPNLGFYYKIVDTTTEKALGPNEHGELRIKYIGNINGYLNNSTATENAFDKDGYFKTGDLAYYDDEHLFYIVDRLKEIFKYKGYHISPIIIEDVFLSHPSVNDVAVIGIPHDQFGELPMAVVILKEKVEITEDELIKYVNSRLPDMYHIRAGVKFVSSLPKTTTGKHRRNFLRNLVLKGQI